MSERFRSLQSQLSILRKNFLPQKFSPVGSYTFPERVSIRAIAYRIMCHAEIENYLEDRCMEVVQTALRSWKSLEHKSQTLLTIGLFSGHTFEEPPKTFAPTPKDQKDWDDLISPSKRIQRCFDQYIKYISRDNHGIREKNLTKILIPLGVPVSKIDPLFISDMDAFGKLRGDAAHTSAAGAVNIGVDPADELRRVANLAKELAALDLLFDSLLKDAAPLPL